MAYNAGIAFLQVVPSFAGIEKAFEKEAEKFGRATERAMERAVPQGVRRAADQVSREGTTAGDRYAGSYGKALRRRLKEAYSQIPDLYITADSSMVDKVLADIRKDIDWIRKSHLKLDLDDTQASAAVERLMARITRLKSWAAQTGQDSGTAGLVGPLMAIVDTQRRRTAQMEQEAEEAARRAGGRFAATFAATVDRALSGLGEVKITADATQAQRTLADVRSQLDALRQRTVGVDLDAAEAMGQITKLRAVLAELASTDPDIQVRADSFTAYAELTRLARLISDIDGKKIDVRADADTSSARTSMLALSRSIETPVHRLGALIAAATAVGPAIVPGAAVAAVALAAIGTAAAGAAAGIGVLALGLSGTFDAVKALHKYQTDADKSAKSLGTAQNAVANAVDGVGSAERALTNARANAAVGARRAARAVVDAQESVTEAVREARQAQLDLIKAQDEARRRDEDRRLQLRGNALAQRQANLDIAEAKRELDKMMANPRASEAEREQARITYEERVLQLDELSVAQRRLKAEQAKFNKEGVNGSDEVKAAQERVRQTTEKVADAQRRVAEAIESQTEQQRQSAAQIVEAQQNVVQAQRAVQQATVSAGVAGGEALDNLRESMESLSPAGRRFALFIYGLRGSLLSLRDSAQEALLPGLQEAITEMLPALPRLEAFVSRMGVTMGRVFTDLVEELKAPVWQEFFRFIEYNAAPALAGLARFTMDVTRGMAALWLALTPFNRTIGSGLLEMAESFARWATELRSTTGYQQFLTYVRQNGPHVVNLLVQMATFIGRLAIAAAETGSIVVRVFEAIFTALNGIPIDVLSEIIKYLALFSATVLVVTAAVKTFLFIMTMARIAMLAWSVVSQAATVALARFTAATATAAAGNGVMATSLVAVRGAATASTASMGAMAATMGGTLLGAIALVVAGLAYLVIHAKQVREAADGVDASMRDMAGEFARTGEVSKRFRDELRLTNPDAAKLLDTYEKLGVSVETVALAYQGNEAAMARLRQASTERQKQLSDEINQWNNFFDVFGNQEREDEIDMWGRLNEKLDANAKKARESAAANQTITDQARAARPELSAYEQMLAALTSTTASASDKATALRQAWSALNQPAIDRIEADEAQSRTLRELNTTVAESTKQFGAHGTSLSMDTAAGLRNRDAVQAAAAAVREKFFADVQATGQVELATTEHRKRTDALINEAIRTGLNREEVTKLVNIYAAIPADKHTRVTVLDVQAAMTQLEALQVAQLALKSGLDPQSAFADWQKRRDLARRSGYTGIKGLAEGGQARGPGTSTSDSILARLSNREFVEPVKSVDYYGVGLFEALRQRAIPREILPGFAGGGQVALAREMWAGDWQMPTTARMTRIPSRREVEEVILSQMQSGAATGAMGGASGPGTSQGLFNAVKAVFPFVHLASGFRPGDWGYHGMNRAADITVPEQFGGPRWWQVFNWIKATFGRNIKELIWDFAGSRAVWMGREHFFTGSSAGPGTHADHIHFAMDQGGLIPQGTHMITHKPRLPDRVLTDSQWNAIYTAATRPMGGGGPQYNFEFKEARLDISRLRAIQDRDAVYARTGRAR